MKNTCEAGIGELCAELYGQEICLWWQNRLVYGVLRGVGTGLLCVDLMDPLCARPVRTFIPLTAISAFRAANPD